MRAPAPARGSPRSPARGVLTVHARAGADGGIAVLSNNVGVSYEHADVLQDLSDEQMDAILEVPAPQSRGGPLPARPRPWLPARGGGSAGADVGAGR